VPYSTIGTLSIDGAGNFSMTQSAYSSSPVQRSTANGTYTVGQDCSLVLKFNTSGNSSNFVPPASFRVQMVDSSNGLLSFKADSGDTLTGSFTAQ